MGHICQRLRMGCILYIIRVWKFMIHILFWMVQVVSDTITNGISHTNISRIHIIIIKYFIGEMSWFICSVKSQFTVQHYHYCYYYYYYLLWWHTRAHTHTQCVTSECQLNSADNHATTSATTMTMLLITSTNTKCKCLYLRIYEILSLFKWFTWTCAMYVMYRQGVCGEWWMVSGREYMSAASLLLLIK